MIGFACKPFLICAYFTPGFEEVTFLLERAILWIEVLAKSNGLKLKTS